jgi:hypothetical protein
MLFEGGGVFLRSDLYDKVIPDDAIAMFPFMRKAIPPNLLFSSAGVSGDNFWRMRSARPRLKGMKYLTRRSDDRCSPNRAPHRRPGDRSVRLG